MMFNKIKLGNIPDVWAQSPTAIPQLALKGASKLVGYIDNSTNRSLYFTKKVRGDSVFFTFLKSYSKHISLMNIDIAYLIGEVDKEYLHPIRTSIVDLIPQRVVPVSFKFIKKYDNFKIIESVLNWTLFRLGESRYLVDHRDPYVLYKTKGFEDSDKISDILLYLHTGKAQENIRNVVVSLVDPKSLSVDSVMDEFVRKYSTIELLLLSYFIVESGYEINQKVEALFNKSNTDCSIRDIALSSINSSTFANFRTRDDKDNKFLSLLGSKRKHISPLIDSTYIMSYLHKMYQEVPYSKQFSIGRKNYIAELLFVHEGHFYYKGSIWDRDRKTEEPVLHTDELKELIFLDKVEVIDIDPN